MKRSTDYSGFVVFNFVPLARGTSALERYRGRERYFDNSRRIWMNGAFAAVKCRGIRLFFMF